MDPEGTGSLGVAVIGEALDYTDASEGLPLRPSGAAGSVFERIVKRCGLDRQQLRIMNTVWCQPPGDKLQGAAYELPVIQHCRPHWEREIERMKPKVIFALGNIPLRTLTGMAGKKRSISALRGYVFETSYGLVLPSLPPVFIKRGKPGYIGLACFDLLRAVSIAKNGWKAEKVDYTTHPGEDEARAFLSQVRDHPNLLVTYDIETDRSLGEEEDEVEAIEHEETDDQGEAWEERTSPITRFGTRITQIQFSIAPGTGIVFPWIEPYITIAKDILATENPKAAHNGWRFDNPILRQVYHFHINGVNHDTRWMWHHMQPDLPANLQTVASVYGMPFPWKHLADSEAEFYGAADVDAPQRIMAKLPGDLEKRGVWKGYEELIRKFDRVLVNMSSRGILLDPVARKEFGEELDTSIVESDAKIQSMVPDEVRKVEPKGGYKTEMPPILREWLKVEGQDWRALEKDPHQVERLYGDRLREDLTLIRKPFDVGGVDLETGEVKQEYRWARVEPFSPNSSQQLIGYMNWKKHPIPWNRKEERETTVKKELLRLGDKTKDSFYSEVINWRALKKMKSTYLEGWKPGPDGRVHSEFGYGPATGQLSSRSPNVQNAPKHSKLAKTFRKCIVPAAGKWLVEFDYHAYHAQTLALQSGDEAYMRIARLDMHSFLAAAGLLKLKTADQILALKDDEILDFFAYHKNDKKSYGQAADGEPMTFQKVRDKQAKPTILGYGFGLGAMHLWEENREYIKNKAEAQRLLDTLNGLFPVTAQWRKDITLQAHERNMLISKHGFLRWFWDVFHWDSRKRCLVPGDDHEKVLAFLPANDAFAHYRIALNRLEESGWNERAGLNDNLHDAGLYEIPDEILPEAIHAIKAEMEFTDPVLRHPVLCPEGFSCEVEVKLGRSWGEMQDWKG
jgi:uracil-DNA glycosylase family 4